jgi:diguanylate cyclase (GGDEF)-like protein
VWLRFLIAPAAGAFDEPVEGDFRRWHARLVKERVRNVQWLATGSLLFLSFTGGAIGDLRATAIAPAALHWFELVRYFTVLPLVAAVLAVTYMDRFVAHAAVVGRIAAPVYGGILVLVDALMRPQGYSLATWLVLAMLCPHQLFGLSRRDGLLTSYIVLLSALGAAWLGGYAQGQWQFDFVVMCLAAAFSSAAHKFSDKSLRELFIDTRRLTDSAHRDSLTGLYNRRMFNEHMGRIWQEATRARVPVSLLLVDIDYFKALNDRFGHQAGDEYLTQIASVLGGAARRPMDIAARLGGEEFVIALYNLPRDAAEDVCRQLQAQIAALALPHPTSLVSAFLTVSIGVACVEAKIGRTYQGVIQLADEALYDAKELGRNQVVIRDKEYETLHTGVFRRARTSGYAAA